MAGKRQEKTHDAMVSASVKLIFRVRFRARVADVLASQRTRGAAGNELARHSTWSCDGEGRMESEEEGGDDGWGVEVHDSGRKMG